MWVFFIIFLHMSPCLEYFIEEENAACAKCYDKG